MNSIDFTDSPLEEEYEGVEFTNCHFSEVDLSNTKFISCEFNSCDLTMAKLQNTAFQEAKFTNCKMLGLHFDRCNPFLFEVHFENSLLNLSSFYQCKLVKTQFLNCQLHEVDFVESNLSKAVFDQCDLNGAQFDRTNLEGADLTTASNFLIHPERNKIDDAKFSYPGVLGLVNHLNIEIQ